MPTLAEIRQQYPQYKDLSDEALADGLHQKFYSDMSRDAFNKKIGFSQEDAAPLPGKETVAPGVPTFDPTTRERAQGMRDAITGPPTGTQQDWFQKQRQIETQMRAAGKSDADIQSDPQWQEASKNLSRSVSAGASQTAIGEVAGGPIAGLAAKGIQAAGRPVAVMVRNAIGRELAAAKATVGGDAKQGVTSMIEGEQRNLATKKALDKVTSEHPDGTVLEVQKPATVDPAKITKARNDVRDLKRQLFAAEHRLNEANTNMAESGKYAGPNKSFAREAAARRDKKAAQRAYDDIKAKLDEAQDTARELGMQNKAALDAGKKETTSANSIEKSANKAKTKITSLEELRSELNAAKDPNDIARAANKIADQMFRAGHMSEAQHTAFLKRSNNLIAKAEDTAKARQRLILMLKSIGYGGLAGAGAGLGLEIRRFM